MIWEVILNFWDFLLIFFLLNTTNMSCFPNKVNKPLANMLIWLPWWLSGKKSACQRRRGGFGPWVRKMPWKRKWLSTLVFLCGQSHGQRSLAVYSPWGHKGFDTTKHTHHRRYVALWQEKEGSLRSKVNHLLVKFSFMASSSVERDKA